MPGPYRNVLTVGEAYQDAAKTQAETDLTRSKADIVRQESLLQKESMDAMRELRSQVQLQNLLGAPNRNNPMTESVAKTEDVDGDPIMREYKQLQGQMNEADNNIRTISQMRMQYAGLPGAENAIPKVEPRVTRKNDITNRMADMAKEISKTKADNAEGAANVLRDANSAASLQAAVNYIARTQGKGEAFNLDRSLPHDPDGNLVYNETAKQAIQPYISRYTDMKQSATNFHNQATLAHQVRADAEKAKHDAADEKLRYLSITHADARTAASQAGANQRAKARLDFLDEGLGLRQQRENRIMEEGVTTRLQADPVIKTYPNFEKAYNSAKNVFDNINDPAWLKSRNVSSAAADDMMQEYRNAIQNFRANSGGKWSVQDQQKYSSMLEKMNAFVQTIGQGKKPDTSVMKDVITEINRIYNEQNSAAVQRTLQAREAVYKRGGDPMNVRSPANIDRAIHYGAAEKFTDPQTGIDYLKFGKGAPSQSNTFPIYTQPKEKKAPSKSGAAVLDALIGGDPEALVE